MMMKKMLVIVFCLLMVAASYAQQLWGITSDGGTNGAGVLFQYSLATATYTKKFDFDQINGSKPYGSLIKTRDGKLYGMTSMGGTNNMGVLFQFDPATYTYSKKFDFNSINRNGLNGSLLQIAGGKLYGITSIGVKNNKGVLFQYDPATSTFTKKFDFDGINGRNPDESLLQYPSDGKLYGVTAFGGANDLGVLFQYDLTTSTYTKKLDFKGVNGSFPKGSLIRASDGKFYGMTGKGGTNDLGVLFQYDPATSTYTKKFDFDGINGSAPIGSLLLASDGKLYGMTSSGGVNSAGVLFQYNPVTSTYTKKLDFDGINGRNPTADLIEIVQCSGDFDGNGVVNINDYLLFVPLFGTMCTCPHDLDHNGDVDINDYIIFAPKFGTPCIND